MMGPVSVSAPGSPLFCPVASEAVQLVDAVANEVGVADDPGLVGAADEFALPALGSPV